MLSSISSFPLVAAAGVFSAEWWQTAGVQIAVILMIAVIVSWVARLTVRRLRKKLGHDFIATRRGHGYCIES